MELNFEHIESSLLDEFDKKLTIDKFVEEIKRSPILANNVNTDVSYISEDGKTYNIKCYNGKRYRLTLEELEDGCYYDRETGFPVQK